MKDKKSWAILLLGLAVGAIVLLAAGLSRVELLPGRPFSLEESQTTAASKIRLSTHNLALDEIWKIVVAVIVWVLFPLSIIYFIISREAKKRVLRDLVWVLSTILIIYFLIRAFQRFAPFQRDATGPAPGASSSPFESVTPADFVVHPPSWLVFLISAALMALLFGLIWFFWQRGRLHRPKNSSELEQLQQEAREALGSLRAGNNLKDTVMRCYLEMNRILHERRGLRRQQAMTPREFEGHLREAGLGDEHIQRLTRLFEGVRYGTRASNEQEKREALACLEAITQAYGGPG